jgi:predicted enzyme related to lactoylglutathione lyase
VPDVAAAAQAVERAGAKILYGPMEVPGGDLICQFVDPQGAVFAVHERRS